MAYTVHESVKIQIRIESNQSQLFRNWMFLISWNADDGITRT